MAERPQAGKLSGERETESFLYAYMIAKAVNQEAPEGLIPLPADATLPSSPCSIRSQPRFSFQSASSIATLVHIRRRHK
jgi:hypothetical protein